MSSLLVRNGRLWSEQGSRNADILIEDGVIRAVDDRIAVGAGATEIDASGLDVLPGLIDFHVHVADHIGRFDLADDFASGSKAAVLTGITTLLSFATQRDLPSLEAALDAFAGRAQGQSHCDYSFHLTPKNFAEADWQEVAMLARRGLRTLKLYTTYKDAGLYVSFAQIESIFRRAAALDLTVLIHCEDEAVLDEAATAVHDLNNAEAHARLRPASAETRAIEQILTAARATRCRIHIVHVSTPEGARLIAHARPVTDVTFETCPQYLFLNESQLTGPTGHRFICAPPLRPEQSREELARIFQQGEIDFLASDHCPFTKAAKDDFGDDIRRVPNGLPGVGALVPLAHEMLVARGGLSLAALVRHLAVNPARRAGIFPKKGIIQAGADADLVLITRAAGRPIHSTLSDCYETYPGTTTPLDFRYVLVRGNLVVADNQIVATAPVGRALFAQAQNS